MKNPVMVASGTFGSGEEFSRICGSEPSGSSGHKRCGKCAVAGKSDAQEWQRVYGGMLNAIGLQNPGIDVFVQPGYSVSETI